MKKTKMYRRIIRQFSMLGVMLLFVNIIHAQVYVEKQSRHRFAQMTFGVDYFGNGGATTNYINNNGVAESLSLGNMTTPRLIIGGTHFWGHADFAVIFPLTVMKNNFQQEEQSVTFGSTIETSFKYFPWRIKHHRFAPYVGVSLTGYYFSQDDLRIENGEGPELIKGVFPLMAGFTFNHNNHLLEAGMSYMTRNETDYYINEDFKTSVNIAPAFFSLSYRYMLDTSLAAERNWESGDTQALTEKLADKGMLNNFFVGVGPSAAFTLSESSYNEAERAFLPKVSFNTFLDLSMGYYMHKPDLSIAVNYRGYKGNNAAYNVNQDLKRQSIGLEVTKMLGDYHGFVPYVGPIVSFENLSFTEEYGDEMIHDITDQQTAVGLTFGWDIRPNRVQTWLLRTNLRWYPKLDLAVTAEKALSFDVLEFNFIQLVYFPGRRKFYN